MAVTETEVIQTENTAIEVYDSPQDMAKKLSSMKQMLTLTHKFFKEVMVPNEDYGVIPGTGDKPSLLKPGAEKLSEFYGYAPTIRSIEEEKDIQTGFYRARVTVTLVHKRTGTLIADGIGEANTYEGRYRYRWTPEWKLPQGIDKDALHCEERKKRDGGTYMMYRMENEDLWSLWNTVLKMGKKRALVDAVLSATRSSGIFTQDVEDMRGWIAEDAHTDTGTQATRPEAAKANGNGKAMAGMSTIPQQKKIYAEAKNKGYDVDALVRERGIESGSAKDLSKQQASDLISWLIEAPPAEADGQQTKGGMDDVPEREPDEDGNWPPVPDEPPPF